MIRRLSLQWDPGMHSIVDNAPVDINACAWERPYENHTIAVGLLHVCRVFLRACLHFIAGNGFNWRGFEKHRIGDVRGEIKIVSNVDAIRAAFESTRKRLLLRSAPDE